MCESTAYVLRNGSEELLLKDVVRISPLEGGGLLVENLLGEQKEFRGRIREIDFTGHKIYLEED